MKKILVTGLCTLHWGRLQYGNIGNYYIIEPLFRLLHKYFPGYAITTTFQMTEEFARKEKIEIVPMWLYYNWNSQNDLKNAYDDGHNKEARKGMLKAACCAGVAFTKSYVGYVHAVAHSLGGQYGTPHGLANAVILPVVLRMYGPACEKKLACLARKAGVVDEKLNDREASRDFIRWIQKMNDSMGIPRTISGIHEKDISMMAKHADQEGNPLYPVPVLMNRKELEQIYYKVKG